MFIKQCAKSVEDGTAWSGGRGDGRHTGQRGGIRESVPGCAIEQVVLVEKLQWREGMDKKNRIFVA